MNRPLLMAFSAFLLLILAPGVSAINISVGAAAPDFTLRSFSGEPVSLTKFRGSIVVVLYWETGQSRSLMALRDIQYISSRMKETGIRVLSITADEEQRKEIPRIVEDSGIDFPVLVDGQREVYGSYGIRVYPSTVIIDRKGKIAYDIPGHALDYRTKIESILRFMIGEITEEQLKHRLNPVREIQDEAALAAERRYNLALRLTEAQLVDQAIYVAQQSLIAQPDLLKTHVLLGYLFLHTDEADKAGSAFRKALEIDPESSDARTGLGAALIEEGRTEEAISILSAVSPSRPNPHMHRYELGRAYELAGETSRSLSLYREVLEEIIQGKLLPSEVSPCK